MPTCVIRGCKNRPEIFQKDKTSLVTFHRFPVNKENLMLLWLQSIGSYGLKDHIKLIHRTSVICSEHFEKKYLKYMGKRHRLLPDAIPTIFSTDQHDFVKGSNLKWVLMHTKERDELEAALVAENVTDCEVPAASLEAAEPEDLNPELLRAPDFLEDGRSEELAASQHPLVLEDEDSLACLTAAELSQQVVIVPSLMETQSPPKRKRIAKESSPIKISHLRKLEIPSISLDSVHSGVPENQTTDAVELGEMSASMVPQTIEKVIVLRAKCNNRKKLVKYPRKIPAQIIKTSTQKSSGNPSVSRNWYTRPCEDLVYVTDMSAVFAASPLEQDLDGTEPQLTGLQLCRVCAAGDEPGMVAIFGEAGCNHKLAEKIQRFLPIVVREDDRLPLVVCHSCVERLDACEQLANTSIEAELKLRLLLDAGDMRIEVEEMLLDKPIPDETKNSPAIAEEPIIEPSKYYVCLDCDKTFDEFKRYFRHCYTIHKKKKCKNCDEFFNTREELLAHRLEAHGIQCDCCSARFVSINDQLSHLRKEHPEHKTCSCTECGKSFNSKYGLAIHAESHQTDRPFLCDTCGKNFKSKRKLKVHKCVSSLTEALPADNICTICGKEYTLRSSLKRHMIRHRGERKFECHICQKRFFGSVYLRNHMVIHDKTTLYECQMCCARYFHKRNMITHLKDKHSVPWNYKCPSCDEIFQNIDDVVRHSDSHIENVTLGLGVQEGLTSDSCLDFQCKICHKYFENIYVLTYHFEEHVIRSTDDLTIRTMENDGAYICNYCGEKMVSNWAMKRHIRKVHIVVQPSTLYECAMCSRQFTSKQQLKQHIWLHTGERPYRCDKCEAGFRSHQALKVHTRIHTGETPYHCFRCPKKFRSSATLRIHQGTHDRPFACPHCGQRFPKKVAMQRHAALHAGEQHGEQRSKRNVIHKCRSCEFVSRTRAAMKKHEIVHETTTTYFNL